MLPKDLREILRLYARRGLADWTTAPPELKRRSSIFLGTQIATNEVEADVTIATFYNRDNRNRLRFIPMPKHPAKTQGFDRAFFLPVCWGTKENVIISYELFIVVNAQNGMAFRFEPAHDRSNTPHNYGHVQMSQKLLGKTITPNTLGWIPSHYPAYPLGTSEPLGMFLSMATAIHGYRGGVLHVIRDIFTAASRAHEASAYFEELKKIVDRA
jgi:hypothetical protein